VWIVAVVLTVGLAAYIVLQICIFKQEAKARATFPTTKILDSWYTKAAGVTKKNIDGTSRQAIIADCRVGESLLLVREPNNPKDPNAIKLCRLLGDQIGYISSEIAVRMADDMDRGKKFSAKISDITGGVKGKRTRGVNIEISVHE
jgi:HIRAN domain